MHPNSFGCGEVGALYDAIMPVGYGGFKKQKTGRRR